MIVDSLARAACYEAALPRLREVFAYLARTDFSGLPDGVFQIGEGTCRAIVQGYSTKEPQDARLEAHRRFIDVQYIVSGEEKIGYAPLDRAGAPFEPYDDSRDIVFLDGDFEAVTLRAGDFALLLPHDAHAPGIRAGAVPSQVRKVVVKMPVEN